MLKQGLLARARRVETRGGPHVRKGRSPHRRAEPPDIPPGWGPGMPAGLKPADARRCGRGEAHTGGLGPPPVIPGAEARGCPLGWNPRMPADAEETKTVPSGRDPRDSSRVEARGFFKSRYSRPDPLGWTPRDASWVGNPLMPAGLEPADAPLSWNSREARRVGARGIPVGLEPADASWVGTR